MPAAPPLPAADTRVAEQRPTGDIGGESERGEGNVARTQPIVYTLTHSFTDRVSWATVQKVGHSTRAQSPWLVQNIPDPYCGNRADAWFSLEGRQREIQ